MNEYLAWRLNQYIADGLPTAEFEWDDIYRVLNWHLDIFDYNLHNIKTPFQRQQIKNYINHNGFCLQALVLAHRQEIDDWGFLTHLENILIKYKQLLHLLKKINLL
jgi:hypothetical protein